ncbi:MAG: alpha/beta fold hydrolase [candidate division WOR-3 bacterium]
MKISKYLIIWGCFLFNIFSLLYSGNVPIIFVHGNKAEGTSQSGFKTFNPDEYVSVMQNILNEHYRGYIAGVPLNCDKNTILSPMNTTRVIYNFSFYNPDGSPGAIGSNEILVPVENDTYWKYYEVVSQSSWAQHFANFVNKVLNATGATKVDVVAHSMGGLVVRSAMAFYGIKDKIRKLIMIATPNNGVEPSNLGVYLSLITWPQWMHRGEGLELGIDKQVIEIKVYIWPPYVETIYGDSFNVTFKNIITGEEGKWTYLLNKMDWAGNCKYVVITGNRNPWRLGLGWGDGAVKKD